MAEVAIAPEGNIIHAADKSLNSRRIVLNERLWGWSKVSLIGLGALAGSLGLAAVAPPVGLPLFITGSVLEGISILGFVGNSLKRLRAKNR